ncbi:hypothetical protein AMECASPLE_021202 [Ameca splendens]|uniref:Uncharacterized protein n=1 Tax=Ameca splendens TaxID=208324 RepID=A0ABV1A9T4_9TELE
MIISSNILSFRAHLSETRGDSPAEACTRLVVLVHSFELVPATARSRRAIDVSRTDSGCGLTRSLTLNWVRFPELTKGGGGATGKDPTPEAGELGAAGTRLELEE